MGMTEVALSSKYFVLEVCWEEKGTDVVVKYLVP